MSIPISLSKKEARKITLAAQGLGKKNDSLSIINQLSYLQIDTISVTERAHNHVLFTRNPKFKPAEIDQLMEGKSIFEYWSHAAAYLPIKDYRFSLYQKNLYKNGNKHWFPRNKKIERFVLDRIKAEGPLQSKDFESKEKSGHAWGQWKPAKMAMTNLFMDGSIMISHRDKFQKVFNLTERVLPQNINNSLPSIDNYCEHLINNAIEAHGLVNIQEIIYLRKGLKKNTVALLKKMNESEKLIPVKIDGLPDLYYTKPNKLEILNLSTRYARPLHILNPFDNLVIQRKRLADLFGFDYLIECYVPEKKRKFGYYTLPILYKDQLVARIDAKADRKTNVFNVKNLWYEDHFKPSDKFHHLFSKQLQVFAQFCRCQNLVSKV